jgi:hypothetical protein
MFRHAYSAFREKKMEVGQEKFNSENPQKRMRVNPEKRKTNSPVLECKNLGYSTERTSTTMLT